MSIRRRYQVFDARGRPVDDEDAFLLPTGQCGRFAAVNWLDHGMRVGKAHPHLRTWNAHGVDSATTLRNPKPSAERTAACSTRSTTSRRL